MEVKKKLRGINDLHISVAQTLRSERTKSETKIESNFTIHIKWTLKTVIAYKKERI